MKCEAAELELSARLDGAHDARLDAQLAEHTASCARCRDFERRALKLRESVRLEEAQRVPDLVPTIMSSVRETKVRRLRPARAGLVFIAGVAATMLIFGGVPLVQNRVPSALAKDLSELVVSASERVEAYHATFEITEAHYATDVPRRSFTSTVDFRSPEFFSARVVDRTRYPSRAWPRNDISFAVDAGRWRVSGPAVCPRQAMPVCASGRDVRSVRDREPFDGDTPLPSDVVVPIRTLADTSGLRVSSAPSVLGHRVAAVTLSYRDAAPLFAYLQEAGSWRPFYPLDTVVVSLDRDTFLPLHYEVRAFGDAERDRWAASNGLPSEHSGEVLFSARATSFSLDRRVSPSRETFDARGAVVPTDVRGLRPYRSARIGNDELFTYSRGLAWLKIRESRSWREPALYGNISSLAMPVRLAGGVVYTEPATATLGRRLSIHGSGWDVSIESNLPFRDLLAIARSLPVRGETVPRSWLADQTTLARGRAALPFNFRAPADVAPGYRLAIVQVLTANREHGVTLYYRRHGTEPDGLGVRLHFDDAASLPPPLDPDTYAVRVNGVVGRYTPARSELEWIQDGLYTSLASSAFDVGQLVRLARSVGA